MKHLKRFVFTVCAAAGTFSGVWAFQTGDLVEFVFSSVLAVIFGLGAATTYLD